MIVKNEECFLEQCLRSVQGAVDEINIVDTGSSDRTVEIARAYGARIEHREWRDDFAWARNESLKMATKRWILQLDADEELLAESLAALEQLKSAPAHLTGVWLRCINASDKYGGGGTVSHAIVRMFPNSPRIRFQGAIHEFPSIDGSQLTLNAVHSPVKIVHHGYLDEVVSARDKYARNMAIIEKSLEREADDAFHWYNLGMTAHLGGDQPRAAKGFERMWELCKKNGMRAFTPNGLQMLADIYSEHLGDPEKGLGYARESLRLAPRYANGHFSAGKAYFVMKRYDEARAMYLEAIADGEYVNQQFVVDDEVPKWKAQCEIGSTYADQDDHPKALEWFEKALVNRPKVLPLRINRATALEKLGRLEEAESALRAVYDDFRDEQCIVNLVNYLLRNGKEREALELIERHARDVRTEVGVSMLLAATAITQQNQWGDGEEYLRRALELDPQSAEAAAALKALEQSSGDVGARFALVQEATSAGRLEDALTLANEAAAVHPDEERFPYYAALACANLDRKNAALEFLDKIPDAVSPGPWFLRAAILREQARYAEALHAIERALVRQPSNLEAMLVRSSLLESMGRITDAEAALRSAWSIDKRRAAIELAGLYLRAGRASDAQRVAEEALNR